MQARVTVSEREQMGCLLVGFDRILYLMARCEVYESLYPPDVNLGRASENFESAFTKLYLSIPQFLARAIRVYARNSVSRAFNALAMSDDITSFENICQDKEQRVDIEAQNCKRLYSKAFCKDLLKDLDLIKDLQDPLDRIGTEVTDMWRKMNEEEGAEILRWISDIPYQGHHTTARQDRTPGTGDWFVTNRKFQQWQASDDSTIL